MAEQKPITGRWPWNHKSPEQMTQRAKLHHALAGDARRRDKPPITLPRLRCLAEPIEDGA